MTQGAGSARTGRAVIAAGARMVLPGAFSRGVSRSTLFVTQARLLCNISALGGDASTRTASPPRSSTLSSALAAAINFRHSGGFCSAWSPGARPGAAPTSCQQMRLVNTQTRRNIAIHKYHYILNFKKGAYLKRIPIYYGPISMRPATQNDKRRALVRDYTRTPRIKVFKRQR